LVGRPVPEDGSSFDVLEVDLESLAQHLNLELEVELQLCKVVEFGEQAQNRHEPWVRKLENGGIRASIQGPANERDRHDRPAILVTLNEELFERDVVVFDQDGPWRR
jgi:hypothetical protein